MNLSTIKSDSLKSFIYQLVIKSLRNLEKNNTLIVGLSGGQGSGKSTIAQILKIIIKARFNLNIINFSIDDYYKTYKERQKMSKKFSKLFLTRGVPGTHDTKLLFKHLKNFKNNNFSKVKIPQFDKSKDDRMIKSKWKKIKKTGYYNI